MFVWIFVLLCHEYLKNFCLNHLQAFGSLRNFLFQKCAYEPIMSIFIEIYVELKNSKYEFYKNRLSQIFQ